MYTLADTCDALNKLLRIILLASAPVATSACTATTQSIIGVAEAWSCPIKTGQDQVSV